MPIVKMSRLTLIGLEDDRQKIIDEMQRQGCVQIVNTEISGSDGLTAGYPLDKKADKIDETVNNINKARDALMPYRGKKKMFGPGRSIKADEFERYLERKSAITEAVDETNRLLLRKSELSNEENRLLHQKIILDPWAELDAELDTTETGSTVILTGTVPAAFMPDEIKKAVCDIYPETWVNTVSSDNVQHYLYVVAYKQNKDDVIRILKKYSFNQIILVDYGSTARANIERTDRKLSEAAGEKRSVGKRIRALASNMEDIEVLYDMCMLEKQKIEQLGKLAKTDKTFMIEGWIPSGHIDKFASEIAETAGVYLDFREPHKDEAYPILLENKPAIKPFELITELFSLPNHREFDVNPFMAPFYMLFFGLMLGDAGYGLVLSVLTGVIIWKFKVRGTMRKLMAMVFLGGVSSFIWGVLFGSWFGDIAVQVSGGAFSIKPLWFDPLQDPMKLLIWSCALGIIQLYTGIGLSGYKMWRNGKKTDAVIDVGIRYIYYTGIILLLTSFPPAKYIAAAGAAGMVLTQGRHKKGLRKITGGILSLYDFVGFMSDVLSYSRLLALGLATAVIASVINTMGTMFGTSIFGIAVLLIIFTGGHLFNIAISTLGAYVHSSRLQYVEFFGKFYEGGGKPYEPFKYDTKYISIDNGGI